jgi:signal transduction histidine kinase
LPKIVKWLLVLLASVSVALLAGLALSQQKRSQARIEVEAVHNELELALATLSVRMASMATAMQRSRDLSPLRIAELYSDLVRSSPRTHERAMAFLPEMGSVEAVDSLVANYAAEYAAAGYPDFRLFPDEPTDALFPAVLVEPGASRANVFGFNLGSSPARVAAARDALDQGVMIASAPVALSQDDGSSRSSFLLFYPVRSVGPDTVGNYDGAVLAAGMTPNALFQDHVSIYDQHIIEVEISLAGIPLRVTLSNSVGDTALRLPILNDLTLPVIRTKGFDVPFKASVVYVPRSVDALLPLAAAAVAALIGLLLVNLSETRIAAKRALEGALRRKEAELRDAYRIQARSQRIEALGRLVGGVAHDFNNILSVILGNLELIKDEKLAPDSEQLVEEARIATQRGARLTRQLLLVGRQSHLQPSPLDVGRVLKDSSAMLRRVLPESIELTTAPAAGLWTIQADADGLNNALLNLAINARDAMKGQGKLIIEAANNRATHDYLDERPEEDLAPGRYVAISVTDTGSGMPPEIVERAFEPFFTTKHATDGSGLGLPSVLGFCRQSGGTCRIYSEPGVGTTVRMLLPVSENPSEKPVTTVPTEPQGSGVARILIAEDEDSVAGIMKKQLQRAGYSVTRVPTGDAAWALLEEDDTFDLLITDLVMPGKIQGAALARRVEENLPAMRLLLISGYPQEAAIEGNGVAIRHTVLTKPVPRTELLRTIEKLLNQ